MGLSMYRVNFFLVIHKQRNTGDYTFCDMGKKRSCSLIDDSIYLYFARDFFLSNPLQLWSKGIQKMLQTCYVLVESNRVNCTYTST